MQVVTNNEREPEPDWKATKLSLERPYKDDDGNPIQVLLDITPDGQVIYEPILDHETKLGERFRRIFIERGHDFFDTPVEARYGQQLEAQSETVLGMDEKKETQENEQDGEQKFMTPEQLLKMRWDVLPRLHVALGEMTQARDLLTLLLSTSGPTAQDSTIQALTSGSSSNIQTASLSPALTPGLLTASTVTPLPPIPSVQAFDTELVVGGKDTALRKASDVLRVAAEGIERSMSRTDSFWADALRIRRANWNLVPAPLPIGAPTGKGSDRTSRDFLIYFGLSQSPPAFRRSAIAHMDFYAAPSASEAPLVFPHRKHVRLRAALKSQGSSSHSQIIAYSHETLEGAIRDAQKEVVESEIFDELIKEASILPTASTRVSERLVVVDAAQDTELSFELVDEEQVIASNRAHDTHDRSSRAVCNLISSALPLLLLRRHDYAKQSRLGQHSVNSTARTPHTPLLPYAKPGQGPQILQPIIDFTQYQIFLGRIKAELERAVNRLRSASVEAEIQFRGIGESGSSIVSDLLLGKEKVGGEAILRIDARHNIRFTFSSPSSLTTHLPHATISIASIPQLSQLLADETERSLLGRICAIGIELCQSLSGAWFVDDMMSRAVGRWEGCVLNFRVRCTDTQTLDCHAHQLLREKPSASSEPLRAPQRPLDNSGQPKSPASNIPISNVLSYSSRSDKNLGLFAWVKQVIEETLAKS